MPILNRLDPDPHKWLFTDPTVDPDPQHWHKKAPHTVYLAAGLLCLVDEDIDLICEDVDLLLYLLLLVGRDPVGGGLLHLGEEQALLAPLDLVAQVVQHPLAESTRQKKQCSGSAGPHSLFRLVPDPHIEKRIRIEGAKQI